MSQVYETLDRSQQASAQLETSQRLQRVLDQLEGVTAAPGSTGLQFSAKCPAHEDKSPSLSISEVEGGKILLHCHAGCSYESITAAIDLPRPEIVATYDYYDAEGTLLYQVCRYEPKAFKQRQPNAKGEWTWSVKNVQRVLYRLPEVIQAVARGRTIFVVEGEKDANRLQDLGLCATTSPGGAGKWGKVDSAPLAGAHVVIFPDNDDAGHQHAIEVAQSVQSIVASIKVIEVPGLSQKGDVTDYLDGGHSADDLRQLVDAAPLWEPPPMEERATAQWPRPDPRMFYGIAGEFVRVVEPHTESDPVALLLQFLIAFGNALGRHASFTVEGARHYLNLFGVLVGRTSKGRKGTSWQYVANLMHTADQVWCEERISSGLSSGEGLIWAVRDPIYGTAPRKDQHGKKIAGEFLRVVSDAGVDDKRLLVMESEFASTLRVMKRDGSTLSAVVRKAWDEGKLTSLTKNSPARATDAHISIIGHITGDELRRELDRTEIANGFVNRFLLVCVQRSKFLPDGGTLDGPALMSLGQRVEALLQQFDFSERDDELTWDETARGRWHEVYGELSAGKPGLFGAVTNRAEAQVTRLACLYAVLDKSRVIRLEHLEAALALWRFVEDSARFLFKESLGDPDADTILAALRATPDGLTRTEINNLFDRNRSADRVSGALRLLEEQGLATLHREQTGGRPRERWTSNVRNI